MRDKTIERSKDYLPRSLQGQQTTTMSQMNLLLVSLVALLLLGTMMDSAAAGDCNGSRCGCYKGFCWAYADGGHTRKGDCGGVTLRSKAS